MKCLLTGMTARMTGSDRVAINYLTVSQLIKSMLEELGHEVDHRHVEVGEDVSGYDLYLIGCAPLHSIGSGRAINMAPIVSSHGDKVVLYAEDWSFGGYGKTCQGALASWEKFLKWRNWPVDQKYKDLLKEFVSHTVPDATCPWPVLLPMYQWGQHSLLLENNFKLKEDLLWDFDPSHFVPRIGFLPPTKKKQWVLSQLSDQTQWLKKLGATWPVISVGNKRLGQPVLDEKDLIQLYAESWGLLASKYSKIAGSGWWRVRYLHAHWVNSVTVADPLDAVEIGEAYQCTTSMVENLSVVQLARLAEAQKIQFQSYHYPRKMELSRLASRLQSYLK